VRAPVRTRPPLREWNPATERILLSPLLSAKICSNYTYSFPPPYSYSYKFVERRVLAGGVGLLQIYYERHKKPYKGEACRFKYDE
jgi:hypothetical protein